LLNPVSMFIGLFCGSFLALYYLIYPRSYKVFLASGGCITLFLATPAILNKLLSYFSIEVESFSNFDPVSFLAAMTIGVGTSVYIVYQGAKKIGDDSFSLALLIHKGYSELRKDYERNRFHAPLKIEINDNPKKVSRDEITQNEADEILKEINESFGDLPPELPWVDVIHTALNLIIVGLKIPNEEINYTIRSLNAKKNALVTLSTTRDAELSLPGPISINETNLVSFSLELGKPVMYSKYPDKHYATDLIERIGLKNKPYMDYITLCLKSERQNEQEIPSVSICIEAMGSIANKRLHTLYDSLEFERFCHMLEDFIDHNQNMNSIRGLIDG